MSTAYAKPTEPDEDDRPYKMGASERKDMLETARKRFKLAVDAEAKQRERERVNLRAQVPELQWPEAAKRERDGSNGAPPRPMLSIPKLDQPVRGILNQARQAHLGVEIHPLSVDASSDTAEMWRGLYRKIEVDSRADVARNWAMDRGVKVGRGFWRVLTVPDPENPFYQVIRILRIRHQDSVYVDPSAQEPDWSDGKWAFVWAWMTEKDFKREHPKAKWPGDYDGWAEVETAAPEWVTALSDGERAVRVAEHWYKVPVEVTYHLLPDGTACEDDDLPEGVTPVQTKKVEEQRVRVCKLSALEVLPGTEQEWDGRYIPIIPYLGRELQPIEGETYYEGIYGPAKDSQMLYNVAVSNVVETASLEPRAPFMIAEGQDEGHEDEFEAANRRNLSVIHYKPTTIEGRPVPPPQRVQAATDKMSISMMLVQHADQQVQNSTAQFDPSLGRGSGNEKSGRAIAALQDQSNLDSSDFLHNFAASITYEAKVILDLAPYVYDTPGRIVRTLDMEGKTQAVMLNQPYYQHPQTQQPVRIPPGQAPPAGVKQQHYNLRQGTYSVSVSVGRARQTLREEALDSFDRIFQAMPDLIPILGPLKFKMDDFPGHAEVADILSKLRDQKFPFLSDKGPQDPQMLAGQVQHLHGQLQQLQQAHQQAVQALETKQAEQQARIQTAQIQAQTQITLKEMENAAKIEVARITAAKDALDARMAAIEEAIALRQTQAHETAMAAQDHAHDQAASAAAHDQAMAQAEQSAALQPQPQDQGAPPDQGAGGEA